MSSGKTITAFVLKEKIPNSYVLSLDWIMFMNISPTVIKARGKEFKEAWIKERYIGRKLIKVIFQELIKEGKSVIAEELFPDLHFLKETVSDVNKLGVKTFVFELFAPFDVLLAREKARNKKDPEPLLREALEVLKKGYPGAIRIDTSMNSPEECAGFILSHIRNTKD